MSKHYNEAELYLTCSICNLKKHIFLGLKQINSDSVFIYPDIDLAILGIDLKSMYIDIIFEVKITFIRE